jgi:hypothetical protein
LRDFATWSPALWVRYKQVRGLPLGRTNDCATQVEVEGIPGTRIMGA